MIQERGTMKEIVLDLETEKEFKEVGGKDNMHLLGISVVGVYQYDSDSFRAYEKEEFPALEQILKETSLLIGFNIKHFDLPVLAPYMSFGVNDIPILDLMDGIEQHLGFRVSLDNLSRCTLGASKSGMGLEAIQWWREGKKDKVKEYCLQDVRLTRDLYEFGKREGFVLCETRDRGRVRVQVDWKQPVIAPKKVLEDALAKRVAVEIEYALDTKKNTLRTVDVHSISKDTFEGFCHTRQGVRVFQLHKVTRATLTNETYHLHNDVQGSLI